MSFSSQQFRLEGFSSRRHFRRLYGEFPGGFPPSFGQFPVKTILPHYLEQHEHIVPVVLVYIRQGFGYKEMLPEQVRLRRVLNRQITVVFEFPRPTSDVKCVFSSYPFGQVALGVSF